MMTTNLKHHYYFLDVIKAVATILIINSHFDTLYPIAALATGGALGNAIFFAVSGFLIYPLNRNFKPWMVTKLLRLYIPAIPMIVFSLFITKNGYLGEHGFISTFIWPTTYWFVGAIILFYLLYYICKNIVSNRSFFVFFTMMSILYMLYYVILLDTSVWVIESVGLETKEGLFKLIYYYCAMMVGKWYRINIDKEYIHRKIYIMGLGISFMSIYIIKLLMIKNRALYHVQFLNHISILASIVFLFRLCLSISEEKYKRISSNKAILFLGKHTLEMYLTQFIVIKFCESFLFPINVLIAIISVGILSWLLGAYSNWINYYVFRRAKV